MASEFAFASSTQPAATRNDAPSTTMRGPYLSTNHPSIGISQVSTSTKMVKATWIAGFVQPCLSAIGLTNNVHPYWRLAIIDMQMMPTISCHQRPPRGDSWAETCRVAKSLMRLRSLPCACRKKARFGLPGSPIYSSGMDSRPGISPIHIVGGGLAGSEAAWQLAERGHRVVLHEMRPVKTTEAHKTDRLAELVCSNTFKSTEITNAHGLLKAEMRLLGSIVLQAADEARVPAGTALAVDRDMFSAGVHDRLM